MKLLTKGINWCSCFCSATHLYVIDLVGCCHLDLALVCTRCMFELVLVVAVSLVLPAAVLGAGRWHQRPILAQEHGICSVCLHTACRWALDLDCWLLSLYRVGYHLPAQPWSCQALWSFELIFCRLLAMALQLPAGELWIQPSLFLSKQVNSLWGNTVRKSLRNRCWYFVLVCFKYKTFSFILAGSGCREAFLFLPPWTPRFHCWKGS